MKSHFVKNGTPDPERRDCLDCRYMKAAVTWWCTHDKARKELWNAGSCYGCDYWAPCIHVKDLSWWQRLTLDCVVIDLNEKRAKAGLLPTPLHPKEQK